MADEKDIDQKVKDFRKQMDREGFGELYELQGRNEHGNEPLLEDEQAEAIIEAFMRGRIQAGQPEPSPDDCQKVLHYFTLALVNQIALQLVLKGLIVLNVTDDGEVVTGKRDDVDYDNLGLGI